MAKSNNDSERISRRAMLAGTTLALGLGTAGAAVRRAAAQTKINQAAAKYQALRRASKAAGSASISSRRTPASSLTA